MAEGVRSSIARDYCTLRRRVGEKEADGGGGSGFAAFATAWSELEFGAVMVAVRAMGRASNSTYERRRIAIELFREAMADATGWRQARVAPSRLRVRCGLFTLYAGFELQVDRPRQQARVLPHEWAALRDLFAVGGLGRADSELATAFRRLCAGNAFLPVATPFPAVRNENAAPLDKARGLVRVRRAARRPPLLIRLRACTSLTCASTGTTWGARRARSRPRTRLGASR